MAPPRIQHKNTVKRFLSVALLASFLTFFASLVTQRKENKAQPKASRAPVKAAPEVRPAPIADASDEGFGQSEQPVTVGEVEEALKEWSKGIVEIGRVKLADGDYRTKAAEFIDQMYAYGIYPVLFKPMKAAQRPFRPTREGALSYYVGGNPDFPEDKGFAINPWKAVRINTSDITLHGSGAVAVGYYEFEDMEGRPTTADFTIGFRHDDIGSLRIVLQHSSLPFQPARSRIPMSRPVTEEEVRAALEKWGDGIVEIGKVVLEHGDYEQKASEVIDSLYGYDIYPVLFKPTKAGEQPFRTTREGALSYFVGGNPDFPEDTGFAITPWQAVNLNIENVSLHDNSAIAMGTYVFTGMDGKETKAEFTFGYKHDAQGDLRIILHHSSLPFESKQPVSSMSSHVTHDEVRAALKAWGDGIVSIGRVARARGDYRRKAAQLVDGLYGYDFYPVLFKPTKAGEQPFRSTREGAIAYFVGGSTAFPKDRGFAITPWRDVRFQTTKISLHESSAIAMGSYEFTDMSGNTTKAEFTFGYRHDDTGKLRIVLHHSSLPFQPAPPKTARNNNVTEREVRALMQEWGDGMVEIGAVYLAGGDYTEVAESFVDRLYGYDIFPVLFKPTAAARQKFRKTREGALSYFVGGNPKFPEDKGWALTPWKGVVFLTTSISLHESSAIAMGTYQFRGTSANWVTAEFTLGFRHDDIGNLRIVLHHSSLPYGNRARG